VNEWVALGGAFAGGALVTGLLMNALGRGGDSIPLGAPSDWTHTLDLLCRAHGARAAWLLSAVGDVVSSSASADTQPEEMERAVAVARLVLNGGGVAPAAGDVVVVTDEDVAAAALPGLVDAAGETTLPADLRRLAAGYKAWRSGANPAGTGGPAWDSTLPALDSVESVTFALCEAARQLTGRTTAVVLRDPNSQLPSVIAVSHGGDRRWLGVAVSVESAAGRASRGNQPVVAQTAVDLLGAAPPDRRRGEDAGTAYPLRDAREGAGALIVFGSHFTIDHRVREQLARLAVAAGPRLAAAAALRAAEARALTDELTGLPNRRALHRAIAVTPESVGALLALDLDHFKSINDTLGHAAGDAALKHIAHVVAGTLREGDMAARTGGEEFALWLPGAGMSVALDVAERVRVAVATLPVTWQGREIALTCSIGVAACPESATQAQNLAALADSALYRAKHGGRNRVEAASPSARAQRGQDAG
jgi:diguanylate cyclase (GGDEF)-like protein